MFLSQLLYRTIYVTGLLTLFSALYVALFFTIKIHVIDPYERENRYKTHAIRPVYNIAFYPMRYFAANAWSFRKEVPDIYIGHVEKNNSTNDDKKMRSLGIKEFEGHYILIGFKANSNLLARYDNLPLQSFVKFTFGRTLPNDSDRFINKLISFETRELMDDPRMKEVNYTQEQKEKIQDQYFKLKGPEKTCANEFTKEYQEQILQHCIQAGYARNIGGGCFHLYPYIVTTTVREKTLEMCSPNKKSNIPLEVRIE